MIYFMYVSSRTNTQYIRVKIERKCSFLAVNRVERYRNVNSMSEMEADELNAKMLRRYFVTDTLVEILGQNVSPQMVQKVVVDSGLYNRQRFGKDGVPRMTTDLMFTSIAQALQRNEIPLSPKATQFFSQSDGTDDAVVKARTELLTIISNRYTALQNDGVQPLTVSDPQFKRVFTMLSHDGSTPESTRYFMDMSTLGGKVPLSAPFIVGDMLVEHDVADNTTFEEFNPNKPTHRQWLLTTDPVTKDAPMTYPESVVRFSPYAKDAKTDEERTNREDYLNELVKVRNSYLDGQRVKREKRRAEKEAQVRNRSRRVNRVEEAVQLKFKTDYADSDLVKRIEASGGKYTAYAPEQVREFLGGFLSNADRQYAMEQLSDGYVYSADTLNRARGLLEHLNDRGVEYEISRSANERHPNQLTLKVVGANNVKIRLLDDNDQRSMIGRVHTNGGTYTYRSYADDKVEDWAPNNPYFMIDYALGLEVEGLREVYKMKSSVAKSTALKIENEHDMQFRPLQARFDALQFNSSEEAEESLRSYIGLARELYEERLNTPDSINYYYAYPDQLDEIQQTVNFALFEAGMLTETELQRIQDGVGAHEILDDNFPEVPEDDGTMVDFAGSASSRARLIQRIRNEKVQEIIDRDIGSFEDGFNVSRVDSLNRAVESYNVHDSMITSMKMLDYDLSKLKGTDFTDKVVRNEMVRFDPSTMKLLDEIENSEVKELATFVQDELAKVGVVGISHYDEDGNPVEKVGAKPEIAVDENGILKWSGFRQVGTKMVGRNKKSNVSYEFVTAEIGQLFERDENGMIITNFASGDNYGFVPGHTGFYTTPDGTEMDLNATRLDRLRAIGFDQMVRRKLTSTVREQVGRPGDNLSNSIEMSLDSTALNELYYKDVYGTRFELDWYEKSMLTEEERNKVIQTYAGRVRFGGAYEKFATTHEHNKGLKGLNTHIIYQSAGEVSMREIQEDLANRFDLVMTPSGKSQGVSLFLANGAKVNNDGTITPAPEQRDEDGKLIPAKAPIRELDLFDNSDFNAWDRNQMAPNQLLSAINVDRKARGALMTFGGWTFDDAYVVSKEFADRNPVFGEKPNDESKAELEALIDGLVEDGMTSEQLGSADQIVNSKWSKSMLKEGLDRYNAMLEANTQLYEATDLNPSAYTEEDLVELEKQVDETADAFDKFLDENGRYRPLQIGDKISDFGGNKGTISLVVDRDMPPEEAKKRNLEREVAIFNKNSELDFIGSPYAPISRHNAGITREMQDSDVQDVLDENGNKIGVSGELNMIITHLTVDSKSKAYDAEAIAEGRGRSVSGQLVWAMNSLDTQELIKESFEHNESAWNTYREYLIATGLDMDEAGTLHMGYHPREGEERKQFVVDPTITSEEFMRTLMSEGGTLKLPFEVELASGVVTDELPLLPANLRANRELNDGEVQVNNFTRNYANIYEYAAAYMKMSEEGRDEKDVNAVRDRVLSEVSEVQSTIVSRQLGGANGERNKHSFLRTKIMSKRATNSATGVITPDPRLDIDTVAVSPEIFNVLELRAQDKDGQKDGKGRLLTKEELMLGEVEHYVAIWRDPALRDGALRGMKLTINEDLTGIAINPVVDKSFDGDFDGDAYGVKAYKSEGANLDLQTKASVKHNLIDKGSEKGNSALNVSMDLVSGAVHAGIVEPYDAEKDNPKDGKPTSPKTRLQDMFKEIVERNGDDYDTALVETNDLVKRCMQGAYGGTYLELEKEKVNEQGERVSPMADSLRSMIEDGAKGSLKSLEGYMAYYDGLKDRDDARQIQVASGYKVDLTGVAGTFSQQFVSLLRDVDATTALEATYVITQGTLQIKHDAEKGAKINDILNNDLQNLFAGKPRDFHKLSKEEKDMVQPITIDEFKEGIIDIYRNELDVDLRDDYLESLSKVLSKDGETIAGFDSMMKVHASPLDRVAYSGGFKELKALAQENASLVDGKYTGLMAPAKMREAREAQRQQQQEQKRARMADSVFAKGGNQQQTAPNIDLDAKSMTVAEVHDFERGKGADHLVPNTPEVAQVTEATPTAVATAEKTQEITVAQPDSSIKTFATKPATETVVDDDAIARQERLAELERQQAIRKEAKQRLRQQRAERRAKTSAPDIGPDL